MKPPASTPSGTTARTRRAILDAAIAVLAEDRVAPMAEIARAAEVGRSTLHRYFPDRATLVRALFADCVEALRASLAAAELERGPASESFRRLTWSLFDLGPRMTLLFNEQLPDGVWDQSVWESAHWPVGMLFHRGQAEGVFDPECDTDWFVRTLWYMLSAGWEAIAEGVLTRHQALERVTRTLERGLLTDKP